MKKKNTYKAPPNLPEGKGQEKKGKEYSVAVGRFYFSAPTERNLIAQGAALCNECNVDLKYQGQSTKMLVSQEQSDVEECRQLQTTTRLAVRNRLTHTLQTNEITEKENVEYRCLRKSEVRSPKTEESRSSYFSAPTERNLIAQGAALCNECNVDLKYQVQSTKMLVSQEQSDVEECRRLQTTTRLAVRNRLTHTLQTNEITEKENVEYRCLRKSEVRSPKTEESRSSYFSAPTERNLIAQGAALCNECNDSIAPRSEVVQGDKFAWDNNNKTLRADRNRLAHLKEKEQNRSINNFTVSQFNNTLFRLLTLIAPTVQSSLSTRREGEEGESSIINLKYKNSFSFLHSSVS